MTKKEIIFKKYLIRIGILLIVLFSIIWFLGNKSFEWQKITKSMTEKISAIAPELPLYFVPRYPQRLILITQEMGVLNEQLVSANEDLLQFTNECDCSFAESHCQATSTPIEGGGQLTKCEPGPIKVFDEVCPSKKHIITGEDIALPPMEVKQAEINEIIVRLARLQGILEKEMGVELEREVATLWPEDAKILKENLEKLRENNFQIIEKARVSMGLPEECLLENCEAQCQLGPEVKFEACLHVAGQQKPTNVKFRVSASVDDLDLGNVRIRNIHLNLPEKIELPDLKDLELPALNIPLPEVTLDCPTKSQSFTFPSVSPDLPPSPTIRFSCPNYSGPPANYQCIVQPEAESQNYLDTEWHFQTLSGLSDKCLRVIERRSIDELDTEEKRKDYEKLIKKCMSPETVVDTIINECEKKWFFNVLRQYWNLPRSHQNRFQQEPPPYEICAWIGRNKERGDRSKYWCSRVIEEISENFTVCIDARPGLVYERNGSLARVYISGHSPGGKLGWNCGGDPGFWNTNKGKVLALEWDWKDKSDGTKVRIFGERGHEKTDDLVWPPTRDTPDLTLTKPTDLTGQASTTILGLDVYTARGAQSPNDRRVSATWIIPGGVQAPNQDDCNARPIETLKQKCNEIRKTNQEKVPLTCRLLPIFTPQLEGVQGSTIIGPGGTCPADRKIGDYPIPMAGCEIAFPSVPKITFPKIIVPDIRLPSFNLPPIFYVKLPNFIFEDLVLPDIELCNLDDCRFRFPDLSFQPPSLKIPEIKIPPVTIEKPGLPKIDVGIEPIQFRPIQFNLPQLISLASLVTPELELPQISLPQPRIEIAFTGLEIDLLNLLLGWLKPPIDFGACISFESKLWGLRIVYPDSYFAWPDFPRIPEIPFCKDIREFCQNVNNTIGEITGKVSEIENRVNQKFQSEIQEKLNKIANELQEEISKEIQQQLADIENKIESELYKHLAKYTPQNIVIPPHGVPIPGVWQVVGEIPCQNVPPLKIDLEDITIQPKPITNYITFPDKITIHWPAWLKKILLSTPNQIEYELPKPDPLLSKLSYSKEITIRLPGLQLPSPTIDFRFLVNPTACLSKKPTGGNPCPTVEIESNLNEIKELRDKIRESSQKIKDVLL